MCNNISLKIYIYFVCNYIIILFWLLDSIYIFHLYQRILVYPKEKYVVTFHQRSSDIPILVCILRWLNIWREIFRMNDHWPHDTLITQAGKSWKEESPVSQVHVTIFVPLFSYTHILVFHYITVTCVYALENRF